MISEATQALLDEQLRMCSALNATSAAAAIVTLDPHIRTDLAAYLQDLNETQRKLVDARGANDHESASEFDEDMADIISAIVELFESDDLDAIRNAPTLDELESGLRAMPGGERQYAREQSRLADFSQRYHDAKAKSGLETIAQVAEKAGLSKTTVHAVESGNVRPQFKTIKKLAKAFGVDPSRLMGD